MPKANEQDLLIVKNINTNDDSVTTDIVKKPHTVFDDENKPIYEEYEEIEERWEHKNGFRFKWNGKAHIIRPGEKKIYPRFLAEHCAEHLTNHVAMRRGVNPADVMSKKAIKREILIGVYQFYESDEYDEGDAVVAQVEQINRKARQKEEAALDIGIVEDDSIMEKVDNLDEDPEQEPDEIQDLPPVVPVRPANQNNQQHQNQQNHNKVARLNNNQNMPSVEELRAECTAMNIELTGKETQQELVAKLKAFA